jgi:hypothetical protein
VDQSVIRESLGRKTPLVPKGLPDGGEGWQVVHAFFARSGFTDAARSAAQAASALLIDLEQLDADLHHA